MGVCEPAVEVLDPDPDDHRLAAVGDAPVAWADGEVLTIALRRPGDAPFLVGTVSERMRPAGAGCFAVRLRVPDLDHACIEYRVLAETPDDREQPAVWQGPKATRPPSPAWTWIEPLEPQILDTSELGATHPVRFWSPPDPQALLVCADGEGLDDWASLLAASGDQVALVGIESSALAFVPDGIERVDEMKYDARADPRARAYLPSVDPPYFAQHMKYAVDIVLPWAHRQVDRSLPTLSFGMSNGAAWAAAAGALHPDRFAGVLAFSISQAPTKRRRGKLPVHALVAGTLEPGFHRETTAYAKKLRRGGTRVRLRTPVRGHDYLMWVDEFLPALRWALEPVG